MKTIDLKSSLTFGYEQTFTIENWWTDEGFTATSDTPLKREKMLALAQEITRELNGSYVESVDIWDHMQYETFDREGRPSFVVTMDPGSIEVKTQPCLAEDAQAMARPLFAAAERAQVVPYRNWWYGVQGGTEGGCHVNMGGFTPESNPLKLRPDLAVKYCAYIHNRPWLHYPFMGLDVGPEGNAMRMDEKEGFEEVKRAFASYSAKMSADQTHQHFENTNLIAEKASFPSLYKLKSPLNLIEDRAQESLRAPEEFEFTAVMRLKIMEELLAHPEPEELQSFQDLHGRWLTSYYLWEKFQDWAKLMGLNPIDYKRFFQRQFPILSMGEGSPKSFLLKEGRRPRVVTDIVKRGDTVISKKIDTNYKRFEVSIPEANAQIQINAAGIEKVSDVFQHASELGFSDDDSRASYLYVDIKVDPNDPVMTIECNGEKAFFNMNDMMWRQA